MKMTPMKHSTLSTVLFPAFQQQMAHCSPESDVKDCFILVNLYIFVVDLSCRNKSWSCFDEARNYEKAFEDQCSFTLLVPCEPCSYWWLCANFPANRVLDRWLVKERLRPFSLHSALYQSLLVPMNRDKPERLDPGFRGSKLHSGERVFHNHSCWADEESRGIRTILMLMYQFTVPWDSTSEWRNQKWHCRQQTKKRTLKVFISDSEWSNHWTSIAPEWCLREFHAASQKSGHSILWWSATDMKIDKIHTCQWNLKNRDILLLEFGS
jgi:hypothetical protein